MGKYITFCITSRLTKREQIAFEIDIINGVVVKTTTVRKPKHKGTRTESENIFCRERGQTIRRRWCFAKRPYITLKVKEKHFDMSQEFAEKPGE